MSIKDILFALAIGLTLCLMACAKAPTASVESQSAMAIPESLCGVDPVLNDSHGVNEDDSRPDVLVIGDSVSLGWYPKYQALNPQAQIVHNACNGMNSRNGAMRVAGWAAERPYWAAIVFNHGLWDVTPIVSGDNAWFFWTDRSEYEKNLRIEADEILKHTNCAIYLLTTEVPINVSMNAEVVARNAIATQVMNEKGIQVLDLYQVSQTAEHLSPGNIHYSETGSLQLAQYIQTNLGCSL